MSSLQEVMLAAKARRGKDPKPYAKMERGGITELACSLCDAVIAKWMPSGQQTIRRKGTQTFIQDPMVFSYLANYREVELEMDDGSKHVTNLCESCMPKLSNGDGLLEDLYASDLAQWASEGDEGTKLAERNANRKPLRVLRSGVMVQ